MFLNWKDAIELIAPWNKTFANVLNAFLLANVEHHGCMCVNCRQLQTVGIPRSIVPDFLLGVATGNSCSSCWWFFFFLTRFFCVAGMTWNSQSSLPQPPECEDYRPAPRSHLPTLLKSSQRQRSAEYHVRWFVFIPAVTAAYFHIAF